MKTARNVEKTRAGATVVFERMRKNLDIVEVAVRVRFDEAQNALESHRSWIYNNAAYLVTADGKRLDQQGQDASLTMRNEARLSYLFDTKEDLTGAKFYYETPSSLIRLPVKFSLKDVELP